MTDYYTRQQEKSLIWDMNNGRTDAAAQRLSLLVNNNPQEALDLIRQVNNYSNGRETIVVDRNNELLIVDNYTGRVADAGPMISPEPQYYPAPPPPVYYPPESYPSTNNGAGAVAGAVGLGILGYLIGRNSGGGHHNHHNDSPPPYYYHRRPPCRW